MHREWKKDCQCNNIATQPSFEVIQSIDKEGIEIKIEIEFNTEPACLKCGKPFRIVSKGA